jgi:hypothetical protein
LYHDSSEALKYADALDYVPDDDVEQIQKAKNSIVNALDRYLLDALDYVLDDVLDDEMEQIQKVNGLDSLDYVVDDDMEQIQKGKNIIVNALDRHRLKVRRRLKRRKFRQAFDTALRKYKMTTFGFATGCFLGCVL